MATLIDHGGTIAGSSHLWVEGSVLEDRELSVGFRGVRVDEASLDLGQWGLYSTRAKKKSHEDLFDLGQNPPLRPPVPRGGQ